jgi:hypothetical protein
VNRLLMVAMLVAFPVTGVSQENGLDQAAERARQAWRSHDAAALVANSPRLLLQLPGAEPSVALGRAQATALLADFLAADQEVEILIRAAKEVEPGRGYVELQRRYRIAGTQDVRSQVLLLGYRLEQNGWSLVELRVVG